MYSLNPFHHLNEPFHIFIEKYERSCVHYCNKIYALKACSQTTVHEKNGIQRREELNSYLRQRESI